MFSEQERSTYPLGTGVGRLKKQRRKQVEVVEGDLETLLEASRVEWEEDSA